MGRILGAISSGILQCGTRKIKNPGSLGAGKDAKRKKTELTDLTVENVTVMGDLQVLTLKYSSYNELVHDHRYMGNLMRLQYTSPGQTMPRDFLLQTLRSTSSLTQWWASIVMDASLWKH